jgi:hypothetical protein
MVTKQSRAQGRLCVEILHRLFFPDAVKGDFWHTGSAPRRGKSLSVLPGPRNVSVRSWTEFYGFYAPVQYKSDHGSSGDPIKHWGSRCRLLVTRKVQRKHASATFFRGPLQESYLPIRTRATRSPGEVSPVRRYTIGGDRQHHLLTTQVLSLLFASLEKPTGKKSALGTKRGYKWLAMWAAALEEA